MRERVIWSSTPKTCNDQVGGPPHTLQIMTRTHNGLFSLCSLVKWRVKSKNDFQKIDHTAPDLVNHPGDGYYMKLLLFPFKEGGVSSHKGVVNDLYFSTKQRRPTNAVQWAYAICNCTYFSIVVSLSLIHI